MKKNYTKEVLLALIFSVCFSSVYSQTVEERKKIISKYDLGALKGLGARFSSDFAANRARISKFAKTKNYPLRIVKEDGRIADLQEIDDFGNLLYYATSNEGSALTSRVNTLHPGGSLGLNLTGLDMFAGLWERDLAYTDHLDLIDRVFNINVISGFGDHATHVAGTIISSGAHADRLLHGRGMAYEATLWNYTYNDNAFFYMKEAATNGMLVSNHSYGLVAQPDDSFLYLFGSYVDAVSGLDTMLFNAPYYLPVFAAGNDRENNVYNPEKGGHDLLSREGVAKNTVTVAAVYEVPVYAGAESVIMSDFSNWGPTDDNRIKPDISDKGVDVYSTVNFSTTSYGPMSGTSMATPGVTGALLLLQQHYKNTYPLHDAPYGPFMKAATLKGLMCHTADEAGDSEGPDSKFGWGVINAERAAQTITKSATNQSVIEELSLVQGEPYTKRVNIVDGEPLMATISWTDTGGVPNTTGTIDLVTDVLVNDLDIRIQKVGGETYFPWRLANMSDGLDVPALNDGDNEVDNIEKVEVPGASGEYIISVTHKGDLDGRRYDEEGIVISDCHCQEFSLIVTGGGLNLATEKNDFKVFNVWPNPAKDVLNVSLQSDSFDEAYVALYDVQGKRVVDQKLNAEGSYINGVLNLGFLNSGVYLMKINQGSKQATKKIVIN